MPDPPPDPRAEQLQLLDALAQQFAGELHDGPVQWMVGAKMQAEAMRRRMAEGQKIEPSKFDALLETLSRGLAEARRMMQGLQGPELAGGQWHQPLLQDLKQTRQSLGPNQPMLDLDFAADTEPLEDRTAATVYRLIREAVWNALRHAGASQIRCRVRRAADRLQLEISDDGRGFQMPAEDLQPRADQSRPGGGRSLGLSGIVRRAQAAGGQARLTTQPNQDKPDQGTRWSIEIPLQPPR